MLLNEKRTTVAYRCPDCGGGIMSAVGLFNLSADMVKLKCTCGKSELKIVYNRDGTVRLTVPCLICSQPHTFTVNASLFFSDELFVLPCPYSDINIGFLGETNQVKAELARTELELLDLLEENGVSDFEALHRREEEALTDPQVMDIIRFVIEDLREENKIVCMCEDGQGDYNVEVLPDAVRISCAKCGASRTIATDSYLGAQAFLDCDFLYLE
jgi:hypothetical protein